MSLQEWARGLRRWGWLALAGVLLAGLVGHTFSDRAAPRYAAATRLLVGPVNTDADTLAAASQLAVTYAELVSSQRVMDATIAALDLPLSRAELTSAVAARPDGDRLLSIQVTDEDPALAIAIANGLARELMALTSLPPIRVDGQVTVVDTADDSVRVGLTPLTVALLAAAAAAVVSLTAIRIADRLSRSVGTEEQLHQITTLPQLGTVLATGRPRRALQAGLFPQPAPDSPQGATYRLLATKLQLIARAQDLHSVVFIAADSATGTAELSANIAVLLADRGHEVVLVDGHGDSERRRQRKEGSSQELTEDGVGSGLQLSSIGDQLVATRPNLVVLPAEHGRWSVRESPSAEVVRQLCDGRGWAIIDAASVTRSPASLGWARYADATILVAQRQKTQRDDVARTLETLRLVGANVVGTVLQARRPPFPRVRTIPDRYLEPAPRIGVES